MRYEDEEQKAVVKYLRTFFPNVLFTISPSGMLLSWQTGKRMKELGYSSGTPDLLIFEPSKSWYGLAIEMKTAKTPWSSKGTLSDNQKEWIKKLIERGYYAIVCYGREEAMIVINNYLKEKL